MAKSKRYPLGAFMKEFSNEAKCREYIIPIQAHFLASEGIPEVLELVKSVREKFNSKLQIAGILLTMYQSQPQLCRSVRESVVSSTARRSMPLNGPSNALSR